jgi:hypothetical protein
VHIVLVFIDALWVSARLRGELIKVVSRRCVIRLLERIVANLPEVAVAAMVALILSMVLHFSSLSTKLAFLGIIPDWRRERVVVSQVVVAAVVAVVQARIVLRVIQFNVRALVEAAVVRDKGL